MSKRNSLRKLISRFPAPPEVKGVLDSLETAPDRAVAIVTVALIEAALEKYLRKKLDYSTENLVSQLFSNRGPLSDFHSKILIATGFGFITPVLGDNLHALKAVKNVFAHASTQVDFDTPEIAAEIQSFAFWKIMQSVVTERETTKPTNRAVFRMIATVCLFLVNLQHKDAGGEALFTTLT